MGRSRDDYLKVGRQLLAEGGIGTVTIANVCARLHVTKGSFYHHFDSAPAFHAALLAQYEDEYAHRRIEAVDAIADTGSRLDELMRRGVDRDHEAESALRAWARADPLAAEVMQRVDAARVDYLVRFLVERAVPEERARVLADLSLAITAGAQALSPITDRRKLHRMLQEHRDRIATVIEESQAAPARRTRASRRS
jgi:AcrR family transcriptional regulator